MKKHNLQFVRNMWMCNIVHTLFTHAYRAPINRQWCFRCFVVKASDLFQSHKELRPKTLFEGGSSAVSTTESESMSTYAIWLLHLLWLKLRSKQAVCVCVRLILHKVEYTANCMFFMFSAFNIYNWVHWIDCKFTQIHRHIYTIIVGRK